jgi:hypothetical protein
LVNKLLDNQGLLTDEALKNFKRYARGTSCECPENLVKLLEEVKKFTAYQEDCLIEKPSDEITHKWLKSTSLTLEHLLSGTIMNLARIEGIIDDENNFVDKEAT